MNNSKKEMRHSAAEIARSYKEGRIAWQTFMDETADFSHDDLIDELVDLIEHEPKRGGFMGVNEKEWQSYQDAIQRIILELEE